MSAHTNRGRVVLLDSLDWEDGEGGMEFRLTYDGPLLASNGGRDPKPARKEYKREVRRRFHPQLKRLWETVPHLKAGHGMPQGMGLWSNSEGRDYPPYDSATVAAKFSLYNGWNFVPLVTQDLRLSCWIDVLYLRRQPPGSLLAHGDIDNRLKTLFDCLSMPALMQLTYYREGPDYPLGRR